MKFTNCFHQTKHTNLSCLSTFHWYILSISKGTNWNIVVKMMLEVKPNKILTDANCAWWPQSDILQLWPPLTILTSSFKVEIRSGAGQSWWQNTDILFTRCVVELSHILTTGFERRLILISIKTETQWPLSCGLAWVSMFYFFEDKALIAFVPHHCARCICFYYKKEILVQLWN